MTLVKCDNGHYYEDSEYDECPVCSGNGCVKRMLDYDETVAIPNIDIDDYDTTVDFDIDNNNCSDEDKTIGAFSFEVGTELITGWLVCVRGLARGKDFRVYHGWNWIGRSIDMDIYIPDDKNICRDRHAAIVFDEKCSKFHLVNQNGAPTYKNGASVIDASELVNGDRIKLGNSEFIFIAFCTEERKWEDD